MRKNRLLLTISAAILTVLLTCSAAFASQAVVDSDFNNYEHQPRFDNCIIIDGVDVSAWQDDIDWEQVKCHGIDYALIRIGWTGLDSPFGTHDDMNFETHYQGAKDAGLLVGVYYYSCATTTAEAEKEAKRVLNTLGGRELDLPVVFDFEYAGRIKDKYENKTTTTNTILAFLDYVRANSDYDTMFYSYRNVMDPDWSPKFYMSKIEKNHRVWIAQYYTDIETYLRPFEFWQYTSSGTVPGIYGSVDCNFWYFDEANYPAAEGKLSIKDAAIDLSGSIYDYSGYEQKPAVAVSHADTPLLEGQDYKKFYIKNVNAGTSYVMLQGKGAYSGTTTAAFTIKPIDLAQNCESSALEDQSYTGSKIKPNITVTYQGETLKQNIDYSVSYKNNLLPGTASVTIKGKRNFSGSITKKFRIQQRDLSAVTPKLQYTATTYTGKERRPAVTIDGLTENEDFIVMYENNINPGTATVKVTGINNCTGETAATFEICLKAPSGVTASLRKNKTSGYNDVKVTWSAVKGADSYRVYYKQDSASSWKYKTVKGGEKTSKIIYDLNAGKKYKFKVIACCSSSNSKDSKVVSRTTLKKVTQNSVKLSSKKNKKVKISWKNIAGETGYEISKSTRKSGTNVIATVKGTSAKSKVLTVEKGRTYYYKVRAYKLVDGVRVYGPWSSVRSYKLK